MDSSAVTPAVATAAPEVAGFTDTGRVRAINEDTWADEVIDGTRLLVVADGMGGHQAGEVASALAVETLVQSYRELDGSPPKRLERAFGRANRAVHEQSVRRADARGMGTTLTAALVDGQNLIIGHAGDSRAYLRRDGQLSLLTRDHSWVGERIRDGVLSEEEARRHRWRSVITNALGSLPQVRLDLFGIELRDGDELLLCSDGLNSVLRDDTIQATLARLSDQPAATAARELVRAANEEGGPDNVTVAIARFPRVEARQHRYSLPELDQSPHPRTVEPEPDARDTVILEPVAAPAKWAGWVLPAALVAVLALLALILVFVLNR